MSSIEIITSLDESTDVDKIDEKEYNIIMDSTNKKIYSTRDISIFSNLSGYIKTCVEDVKGEDIYIPSYVDEDSLNIIINFINLYSKSSHYKLNLINNSFDINISKPVKMEETLKQEVGDEVFYFIKNLFARKIFNKILNVAMCLDVSILIEIICAKIALDIKYLSKREIEIYFQNQ